MPDFRGKKYVEKIKGNGKKRKKKKKKDEPQLS